MSRAGLTLALFALPGCGIDLGGELPVLDTAPNGQAAADATLVESGGDDEAFIGTDVGLRTPDGPSAAASADAFAFDAGQIPTMDETPRGTDSSSDASVVIDHASDTSANDVFLSDVSDASSGAITDASDERVSACAQLLQCCNQLTMTGALPPVLATCFAQP